MFLKIGIGLYFNSVTLKNTQTEPQKYVIFFQQKNIWSRWIKYKKKVLDFVSTLRKIIVRGFVNQELKKLLSYKKETQIK